MQQLELPCPHCGHLHDDPFDVLEQDQLESMRCEACGKPFWFAIMECHRCGDERVHTWSAPQEPALLDQLTCESCVTTYRDLDEAVPW